MQRPCALAIACVLAACSGKSASGSGAGSDSGSGSGSGSASATGSAASGSAPAEVPLPEDLALGVPGVEGFAYRKRGGEPAYRDARKAEGKDDWPAVIAACRAAIAKDATHLDAHWLLAVALARTGAFDEVTPHLATAVGGDFARWSERSLTHPMLAAFLASPAGAPWRVRIQHARERYVGLLASAQIVSTGRELFAVEVGETQRWHKLTTTGRRVIAALRSPDGAQIAYVARARSSPAISVGLVDLANARFTPAPGSVTIAGTISLVHTKQGFVIGGGAAWYRLDATGASFGSLIAMKASEHARVPTTRPRLDIAKQTARMKLIPRKDVTADWDGNGLASALRVAPSNRIISVPSPGLIDGNTLTWSPDRAHLAFVAQLDETCAPKSISAAAFVANASTGVVTELVRAGRGIAIEWVGDRRLAIAADEGVALHSLDGTPPAPIPGAVKLVTPKKRPRCSDVPDEPEDAEDGDGPR